MTTYNDARGNNATQEEQGRAAHKNDTSTSTPTERSHTGDADKDTKNGQSGRQSAS